MSRETVYDRDGLPGCAAHLNEYDLVCGRSAGWPAGSPVFTSLAVLWARLGTLSLHLLGMWSQAASLNMKRPHIDEGLMADTDIQVCSIDIEKRCVAFCISVCSLFGMVFIHYLKTTVSW